MTKIILILSLIFLALPAQAADLDLEIDLIWQASTLVPEIYQGRALPIRGSTVTVQAIGADQDQIFDWYLDRDYMKYASGMGRNSFSFIITEWPGYEHTVRVKINNSYASAVIDVQEPEVHLGLREYIMQPGQSKTFQAVPYFFTSNNLDFSWFSNNQKIEHAKSSLFTMTITPKSGPGTQKLDIMVKNLNSLLERAQQRIVIQIQ